MRHQGAYEQKIDGQSGGAAHERCDHYRDEAFAAISDGTRTHDGRHGTGERGQERDESSAAEPKWSHETIDHEGGAGHVAAIFKDTDEQEEYEDLREEHQHTADPAKQTVADGTLDDAGGQHVCSQSGSVAKDPLDAFH